MPGSGLLVLALVALQSSATEEGEDPSTLFERWRAQLESVSSGDTRFEIRRANGSVEIGRWRTDGRRHRADWAPASTRSIQRSPDQSVYSSFAFDRIWLYDGVDSYSYEEVPGFGLRGTAEKGMRLTQLVDRDTPTSLWFTFKAFHLSRWLHEDTLVQFLSSGCGLPEGFLNLHLTLDHPIAGARSPDYYSGHLVLSIDPTSLLITDAWEFKPGAASPSATSLPSARLEPLEWSPRSRSGGPTRLVTRWHRLETGTVGPTAVPIRTELWCAYDNGGERVETRLHPSSIRLNHLQDADFQIDLSDGDRLADYRTNQEILIGDHADVRVAQEFLDTLLRLSQLDAGAASSATPDSPTETPSASPTTTTRSCGEMCLYLAARASGLDISLADVQERLSRHGSEPHRLSELRRTLTDLDVETEALDLPFSQLGELLAGHTAIVHQAPSSLKPEGHFYVLHVKADHSAWILDPPGRPVKIDQLEPLRERWEGKVLVVGSNGTLAQALRSQTLPWNNLLMGGAGLLMAVGIALIARARKTRGAAMSTGALLSAALSLSSCEEQPPPHASMLAIDRDFVDHGRVPWGTTRKTDIVLSNRGSKPVHLSSVSAGCGCLKGELSENPIPPGRDATLSLDVEFKGASGIRDIPVELTETRSGHVHRIHLIATVDPRRGPVVQPTTLVIDAGGVTPETLDIVVTWVVPPETLWQEPGSLAIEGLPATLRVRSTDTRWTRDAGVHGESIARRRILLTYTAPQDPIATTSFVHAAIHWKRGDQHHPIPLPLQFLPPPAFAVSDSSVALEKPGHEASVFVTTHPPLSPAARCRADASQAGLTVTSSWEEGPLRVRLCRTSDEACPSPLHLIIEDGRRSWPLTLDLVE